MSAAFEASHWLTRACTLAPSVPLWLKAGVAKMLANPATSSDGLLAIADALTEAADVAAIERSSVQPRHLDRIADLVRSQAPLRADFT